MRIIPVNATKPRSSLLEHDITVFWVSPHGDKLYIVKHHPLVRGENDSLGCHSSDKDTTRASSAATLHAGDKMGVWCVFRGTGLHFRDSNISSRSQAQRKTALCLPDMLCHASLGISAFVHPSSSSLRGDHSQIDATFNFY